MGFKKNEKKEAGQDDRPRIDMKGLRATPSNVRVLSDTCVSFTLKCDGFAFYNMRLVEKNGNYYIFSSQTKGKDGRYYDNYAVYFTDDDKSKLIATLLTMIETQENGKR